MRRLEFEKMEVYNKNKPWKQSIKYNDGVKEVNEV
jgi:hypothetical protein